MKTCTKCGVEKALTEFYRKAASPDGHQHACKACANESVAKWRAANPEYDHQRYWANPEKVQANVRKWRAANPEKENERTRKWKAANPEKVREASRKWKAANPENGRKWKAANPEKVREAGRKWRAANPEKARATKKRRYDRLKALPNTLTELQFLVILTYYRFSCAYCGKPWQEEDHVIPVVQGGGRTKENIVPACNSCNSRKGARTPEQAGMTLRKKAA